MVGHVLTQMQTIPGQFGKKMDDWVELQHQSGRRARIRWRNTRDIAIRANGRARAAHRGLNAEVIAQKDAVAQTRRGTSKRTRTPK